MYNKIIKEVLSPTVRVRSSKARGSGVIIHSTEENGTYVLTNFHVVDSNVEYKEVWDELLQRDVKREFWSSVEIDIPKISDLGDQMALTVSNATVVIGNRVQDLALLRLTDREIFSVAHLFPESECEHIPLLTRLAACGAAMGEKPIVTFGELNGRAIEIDNYEYDLSSAQTIFGNSGGGVFTQYNVTWCYCGIPSRIRVAIMGFSADAVTHMGYFIPIRRIYKWLRDNCYEYLWDTSISKEECDAARQSKREKELAIIRMREQGA